MSEQQLVATVHVRDLQGRTVVLEPGDDVPAWAVRQITNPKAWVEVVDTVDVAQAPTPPGAGGVEAPPRSGKGSGVEAWRSFADRKGVDVDQDATREDVIAACEAAGVVEREE
ncbi:hypothetical protein OIU91_28385 [Streptomyces sp. NBC_01456]|uniref:hypothetical protein n=1 Tax=unclassified Streptomyces TaxID=2593676 RepID=UPI002E36BB1F|nr:MULTISPECIES: hypothetical protein [unclassified Streptomyces]